MYLKWQCTIESQLNDIETKPSECLIQNLRMTNLSVSKSSFLVKQR